VYAVIETGGNQFKVAQGDTIKVPKIGNVSETVVQLDKVLLISKDDTVFVGQPYLENASVKAEIQGSGKSPKILVYKQKPRKGFRRLKGHRQEYTVLKISDIVFGGKHGS
jgi:large subunit ribosomal protein L21